MASLLVVPSATAGTPIFLVAAVFPSVSPPAFPAFTTTATSSPLRLVFLLAPPVLFLAAPVLAISFLGSTAFITAGDYDGDQVGELAVLLHSFDPIDIAPFEIATPVPALI